MEVAAAAVTLSGEHAALEWLTYAAAFSRLEWESNRVALTELHNPLMGDTRKFPPSDLLTDGIIELRLIRILEATEPGDESVRPAELHFLARAPEYRFAIHRLSDGQRVGRIHLRITDDPTIIATLGHVGYAVDEAHRRNGCALRAVRLILGVARYFETAPLWILIEPETSPHDGQSSEPDWRSWRSLIHHGKRWSSAWERRSAGMRSSDREVQSRRREWRRVAGRQTERHASKRARIAGNLPTNIASAVTPEPISTIAVTILQKLIARISLPSLQLDRTRCIAAPGCHPLNGITRPERSSGGL